MSEDLAARILAAIEESEQEQRPVLAGSRRNGKNTARAVLRRCAADRRMVEKLVYYGTDGGAEPERRDRSRMYSLLVILAEGYGITEEDT